MLRVIVSNLILNSSMEWWKQKATNIEMWSVCIRQKFSDFLRNWCSLWFIIMKLPQWCQAAEKKSANKHTSTNAHGVN